MNQNPYGSKYPGSGHIPQANPSDGGQSGIGSDSLGTQVRDWSLAPILAQIQTHGSGNAYAFREMFITAAGAVTAVVSGGVQGTAATTGAPAYEVNGITSVNSGTVVQLWPFHGEYPGWGFVSPGGTASLATTCTTVVLTAYCTSGSLTVVSDMIRVAAASCP